MNHEASMSQCINAMVIEQNVQNFVAWDSEKKEFLGIVTIRDLLELLVYIYQRVKESINREDLPNLTEKSFILNFLEKYMTPNSIS